MNGKGIGRKRKCGHQWKLRKRLKLVFPNEHTTDPGNTSTNRQESTPMAISQKPSDELLKMAPKKTYTVTRRIVRAKRVLFQKNRDVVADAMDVLKEAGLLPEFTIFLQSVACRKFPMDNLAFRVFLETVRWFSLESTTQMRYSKDTLDFWRTGFRLFGEKFILFMGGMKNVSQLVMGDTSRGSFDPLESGINFAVPSVQTLMSGKRETLPSEIAPGVIDLALNINTKEEDYILSVDGKKVVHGINNKYGDVDLFGHEPHTTAGFERDRAHNEKGNIDDVINKINVFADSDATPFPTVGKTVENIVKCIGIRLQEVRGIKEKQMYALDRITEKAKTCTGDNPFNFALSSIRANIFQIDEVVTRSLTVLDNTAEFSSAIQGGGDFVLERLVDRSSQHNWASLKTPTLLPPQFKDDLRYTQQRSDEWFSARSQYKVTGSTIHNAIGLRTLKEQKLHFDKFVFGVERDVSETIQLRMKHGVDNEINAVATLTSVVMPFLFPNLMFVEVGSYNISANTCDRMILVSPDGMLCEKVSSLERTVSSPICYACEIKCPAPDSKTSIFYSLPQYYVCQVLAEMAALSVKDLIFMCYTKKSSTVFHVTFDENLWKDILKEIERLYSPKKPQRPTHTTPFAEETRDKLKLFVKSNVHFLGEFKSRELQKTYDNLKSIESSPYLFANEQLSTTIQPLIAGEHLVSAFREAKEITTTLHTLCRRKGTEVLVWILQNTDRYWNPEAPHSLPIAYALKGYGLSCQLMRNMTQTVLRQCFEAGKNVIGMSFDGQWVSLLNRSASGKPLTLLQLQKDVWSEAKSTRRSDILKYMYAVGKVKLSDEKCEGDIKCELQDGTLIVSMKRNIFGVVQHMAYHRLNQQRNKSERTSTTSYYQTDKSSEDSCVDYLPSGALEKLQPLTGDDAEILAQNVMVIENNDYPSNPNDDKGVDTQPANTASVTVADQSPQVKTKLFEDEILDIEKRLADLRASSVQFRVKLEDIFKDNSAQLLMKMTQCEIEIIRTGTERLQIKESCKVYKSWTKIRKCNTLSRLIGDGSQIAIKRKTTVKHALLDLKQLSYKAVSKLPKMILNVAYASLIYSKKHEEWISDCPFGDSLLIAGIEGHRLWFSYPERHDKNKYIVKCLDGHHMLVNLRVKICKDGVAGICKEAWHSVADHDQNIISKSLVVDLIDKQRNSYARKTFSTEVQNCMLQLGFDREAEFSEIIREWYEAEDDRGLPALERTKWRMRLRDFLLEGVSFESFPPFGLYIRYNGTKCFSIGDHYNEKPYNTLIET